jgi:PST family polysaccharide transporter
MKNLRSRTVSAAGWALGTRITSQVISFAFGIALARLLVPDDFGLFAMIMVFAGISELLSDVGLGSALIQKNDVREEHFSTVFWLNLLLSSLLMVTLYYLSTGISNFYERPEIENIAKVLSLGFPISAMAMVQRTRFVKNLEFKYISLTNLAAMIVSGVVGIAFAANNFGYWSLVAQQLTQRVVATSLIWVISDWRPRSGISICAARELIWFGITVFGTRLLNYTGKSFDKLLIGKILGGHTLGIYEKAYSFMLFPLNNVSHSISQVMFPSLSLIQSDKERVRRVYIRTTRAIAILTFPMMAGMFVVADSFVLGALGSHWKDLIPVLRIFCIAGIATSIGAVTGSLYKSQGAVALQFRVNLLTQSLKIAGVIAGIQWGLIGVATGFTIAALISSQITMTIGGRLVNLRLLTILRTLAPTLLSALIMAILVWTIRPVFGLQNELVLLITQIMTGCLAYIAIMSVMRIKAYQDVREVLKGELARKRKGSKQAS